MRKYFHFRSYQSPWEDVCLLSERRGCGVFDSKGKWKDADTGSVNWKISCANSGFIERSDLVLANKGKETDGQDPKSFKLRSSSATDKKGL